MRISHVKISQILGINDLEFSPTGFTEISGANGSGKSSVLTAIKSALSGGHDASLLRQGAKSGEVVLVLDDGTSIRKRVTGAGTNVEVMRGNAVLKKPATVIAELADLLSVNPVEFLRAADKDRVQVLLQCMPIDVDHDRVQSIVGGIVGAPDTIKGLDLLEFVRKQVYDQRTGVNRALKDKDATIRQLEQTLPHVMPPAPETDQSLVDQLGQITSAFDAECDRIRDKLTKLQVDSDERVRNLQEQISAERESMSAVSTRANGALEEARADYQIAKAAIDSQLAGADEAKRQHARYQQTVETVGCLTAEAAELKDESDECVAVLDNLAAYKAGLLASLPIPGLEIKDGQVFRDGIAFDRLNEAQKVKIAIDIARLRAGELGLICVDGLELLDTAAYDAFRKEAEESGLQLIVSKVSDGPLMVEAA